MKTREDFMAGINFVKPKQVKSHADFSINLSGKKNTFNVYFRNNCRELFGDYVVFGIFKDRLIIEPSDANTGFKITVPTRGYTNENCRKAYGHVTLKVPEDLFDAYKEYIGDYEFKYDNFYEYYYVQKKE